MKHLKTTRTTPPLNHGRATERFAAQVPVEMGIVSGLTRDISATGIYFETETKTEAVHVQVPGSHVCLLVEFTVQGEKLTLRCDGEVVRVDQKEGKLGIAAKLKSSFFSDTAEVIDFAPG